MTVPPSTGIKCSMNALMTMKIIQIMSYGFHSYQIFIQLRWEMLDSTPYHSHQNTYLEEISRCSKLQYSFRYLKKDLGALKFWWLVVALHLTKTPYVGFFFVTCLCM